MIIHCLMLMTWESQVTTAVYNHTIFAEPPGHAPDQSHKYK